MRQQVQSRVVVHGESLCVQLVVAQMRRLGRAAECPWAAQRGPRKPVNALGRGWHRPASKRPLVASLYIMGVLGLYTIYEGIIGKFSFWSMIGGLFWVFLGFHLIYRFYLMTEIVRQHDEKAMLAHSTLRRSDMN